MKETIIALYHGYGAGYSAIEALLYNGFTQDEIGIITRADKATSIPNLNQIFTDQLQADGIAMQVTGHYLWLALCLSDEAVTLPTGLLNMGIPPDYATYYLDTLRQYGMLIALTIEHDQMKAAIATLRRYNPIDVEHKLAQLRQVHLHVNALTYK